MADTAQAEIIARLRADRPLAHRTLFAHRHEDNSPAFHKDLLDHWHSPLQYVQFWAFRGGAKSTLSEEAILLRALLREFHNCGIVGSSIGRAAERLESIKHEAETNTDLQEIFGPLIGPVWSEERIVLANGVVIQALGRGQKLRGLKYINWRPDLWVLDDINEDEESRDPVVQAKTIKWFFSTLLPAGDPRARVRMSETPRDPEGLPVRLRHNPQWTTRIYPIEYPGSKGERVSQWPARFPLEKIDELKALYASEGRLAEYNNEYMCRVDTGRPRDFVAAQMKVEPRVRTWEPVYAFVDPARTVNVRTSATTGYGVWSWVSNRLIIWKAKGEFHKPDEMISEIFDIDEKFRPIFIGVEKTGLNEFIMQPLRHEMVKRGRALPIKGIEAPKSKIDFILGLQPFFNAGEVTMAEEMPDLRAQLLGFPQGRIDVPNALAYALHRELRPGQVIYEDFSSTHVVESIHIDRLKPVYLATNASGKVTTAVLCQMQEGRLAILADWVHEGEPGGCFGVIHKDAQLESGAKLRVVLPPWHYDQFQNVGLVQAASSALADKHKGTPAQMGRDEIRGLMRQQMKGIPAFQVAHGARWTLNALAGGYARNTLKTGGLAEWAEEGTYRVLMEGIESFAGLMHVGDTEQEQRYYATTRDGRRYTSALARR